MSFNAFSFSSTTCVPSSFPQTRKSVGAWTDFNTSFAAKSGLPPRETIAQTVFGNSAAATRYRQVSIEE